MRSQIPHAANPNPNGRMLAFHFLRALARIQCRRGARRAAPPSLRSTVMCGRRIRRAAYASMALAAGPRRVWGRAVLRSLRRPPGAPTSLAGRRLQTTRKIKPRKHVGGNQEDELRQLVPGGGRMDLCSLLEETGNYVQCLRDQVMLMKRVADSMSAGS